MQHQSQVHYSAKKGAAFGTIAGSVAGIAFTGIMLWLPMVFGMPTGTFLQALGSMVTVQGTDFSTVRIAAFGLILAQCIGVAIIFGIIVSKVRKLYPSTKGRGVGLGLIAGFIAFLIFYIPMVLGPYSNALKSTLANYPPISLSLQGGQNYVLTFPPFQEYMTRMESFGLMAYLAYGFMMGGIVAMSYSILHFNLERQAAKGKEDNK